MNIPKVLIFGYGNPSRGDDALGPALIESIEAKTLPAIECQNDMQLQVEHVTDIQDRELILFVDADASCHAPFHFSQISAVKDDSYTSHAMSPYALLHAYHHVYGMDAPPAFLLRVRGYQFELGEDLSRQATTNLSKARLFSQKLCNTPDVKKWLDYLR
ncbi:MAG: hydrogenase maturation protease [Mariprofundaceae bacterium]|nr:hydrogenase maturation protease [Mariprofundaceae bacterium]